MITEVTKMKLTLELKREIRKMMNKRKAAFLIELKKRLAEEDERQIKLKKNDNTNINSRISRTN